MIVFLKIWWLLCEIFCHQLQVFPNRLIKLAAFCIWNIQYFKYCYFSLLLTVCSGNAQQSYVLSWCSDLRSPFWLSGPLTQEGTRRHTLLPQVTLCRFALWESTFRSQTRLLGWNNSNCFKQSFPKTKR